VPVPVVPDPCWQPAVSAKTAGTRTIESKHRMSSELNQVTEDLCRENRRVGEENSWSGATGGAETDGRSLRRWWLLTTLICGWACTGVSGSPGTGGMGQTTGTAGTSTTTGAGGAGATSGTAGATMGTAGAGETSGSAGTGATTGTGGAGATVGTGGVGAVGVPTGPVLERNNHPSRDANFKQPALTRAAAARMALDTGFDGTYTGAVFGSPLYVEDGAWGAARFVVVTSGNDVYAIDGSTGAMVWTVNLGAPAAKSGVTGCDGSNPLGVISTPVIDAGTGTLYVAGAVGDGYGITAHQVWAVALADGAVKAGYPIDVSTKLGFDPKAHNQRGALSLVGGTLYVPYGGHSGDCAGFQGRIVTVNTAANPPTVGGWASAGTGEGIWASAGMASAGDGVFAVTGNHLGTASSTHTDSEEVAHVRGAGTLDKSTGSKDVFFASDWKTKDQRDFDLGAVNPILVSLPGSTGPAAVIVSKDGNGFILDTADLGKGPLAMFDVTMQGMYIRAVPTAYVAGATTFYTIPVEGAWTGCPGATSARSAIMAFAIAPSSPLKPSVVWCASYSMVPKGSDEGVRYGGPAAPGLISTTTDGSSEALVWYMDGGNQLVALDGATGAVIYQGVAAECGSVRKWTSPIATRGRIVVAADNKLCSWSPH
jgi:hypothetical protein